ncbi:MAG: peptidoglycan-binding domain-containing protein [Pseudomonadota bacterium]
MGTALDRGLSYASEWLLGLAGVSLVAVLIAALFLSDPYWELSAVENIIEDDELGWPVPADVITVADANGVPRSNAKVSVDEPAVRALSELPLPLASQQLPRLASLTPVIDPRPPGPLFITHPIYRQSRSPGWIPSESMSIKIEEQLDLTTAERAEIQRRLYLAGHDPKGIDGIFGEGTRRALAAMQEASDLGATGYVDARTLFALREGTEKEYLAWRSYRAAKRAAPTAAEPPERPVDQVRVDENGCRRDPGGEIIPGQSFRCDLNGFRENAFTNDPEDLVISGPER